MFTLRLPRSVPFAPIVLLSAAASVAVSSDVESPAAREEKPAKPSASQLIAKLGDESFAVRERAMKMLIEAGAQVEKAVQAAAESGDPEVSYRSRNILREIQRNRIARQRAAFLDGELEQLGANTLSWERMKKLVGDRREARALFIEMQKTAEDLLTDAEKNPKRCAQRIAQLYQEDQNSRRLGGSGLPSGVVAAMVLIGSNPRVPLDSSAVSRSMSLLYRQRSELGENDTFRKLLTEWIEKKASGRLEYQFLRLAQQFKLKSAVELARKMIRGGGHASHKAQALLTLGMLGDSDDVAILEKHIDNDTRIGARQRGKQRIECKLGDVALAMCLALTEQKAKQYGFPDAPNGRPANTSYYQYGFANNQQRAAARKKWKTWRESQQAAEE